MLQATKGWAASETGKAYIRARELSRQVGETPQLFSVLMGLWGFYLVRAEHRTARGLGEQLFSLAQNVHSPIRLLWAYNTLEEILFFLGEFALAESTLSRELPSTIPRSALSPVFCRTPGWSAYPIWPGPRGILAMRTKP